MKWIIYRCQILSAPHRQCLVCVLSMAFFTSEKRFRQWSWLFTYDVDQLCSPSSILVCSVPMQLLFQFEIESIRSGYLSSLCWGSDENNNFLFSLFLFFSFSQKLLHRPSSLRFFLEATSWRVITLAWSFRTCKWTGYVHRQLWFLFPVWNRCMNIQELTCKLIKHDS